MDDNPHLRLVNIEKEDLGLDFERMLYEMACSWTNLEVLVIQGWMLSNTYKVIRDCAVCVSNVDQHKFYSLFATAVVASLACAP